MRIFSFVAILCLSPLVVSTAAAHALLVRAVPPVGSVVETAPASVSLKFTEQVEPVFSQIRVFDQEGRRVDKGDKHSEPKDPSELTVSLKLLAPGSYKVTWRAVSVDTHVTTGAFTFDVGTSSREGKR